MSTVHRDNAIPMGRCAKCDYDLVARNNRRLRRAHNYCTNPKCPFFKKAHPTGSMLNEGKQ